MDECAQLKLQPLDADQKPKGDLKRITEVENEQDRDTFIKVLKEMGWDGETPQQVDSADPFNSFSPSNPFGNKPSNPFGEPVQFYYASPTVQPVKLSVNDISDRIQADFNGQHMVSENLQAWKPWKEVAEIVSKVVINPCGVHTQEMLVATPSKRSLDDLVQQIHTNRNAGQIISIDNGKTWNHWTTFPWLVERVNNYTPKKDIKPTNPFDR